MEQQVDLSMPSGYFEDTSAAKCGHPTRPGFSILAASVMMSSFDWAAWILGVQAGSIKIL